MKRFKILSRIIRSLDFKVLALIGFVILSMAVGSLLLFKRLADQAQSLLFDALDAMSHAVHESLTTQFYERYYDVQSFARSRTVQSLDSAAIASVFNGYVQLYGMYDLILLIDAQGRLVGSNTLNPSGKPLNTGPLQSYDFSHEPWFQGARRDEIYVDEPAFDPYLKMIDGRSARTNTFATVVTDSDGRTVGVICIRAGVRWIQKELDTAYAMFHAGGFSVAQVEVINSEGELLVQAGAALPAADAEEIPVTYPGTASRARFAKIWSLRRTEEGDLMVASSFLKNPHFAPSLGWSIRLTVGTSTASRELADTVRMSYGLILLASVGLLLLAIAYIRRLVLSQHLRKLVSLRTAELHKTAADLEERNRELERSRTELMDANDQLIEAQKELLDTAKRLGQAEVAALTLHNIGNIITSLNVQSTLLREHWENQAPGQVALDYLKKISAEGRYPERLPEHVERLETAEAVTRDAMQSLIRGLIDNVRIAMAAISSQLAFVQQRETAAAYKLSELLHHTMALYFGTFKRHRIQLEMQLQEDVVFETERFRFESILTVLIRNAIDAIGDQPDPQISFGTKLDAEFFMLAIRDNGHGFDADVANRIFRFGFTTKNTGHGFGLHYAANSCKHLGLQLKLESPGPSLGATALLLIPREKMV
ncbi:sensor histidine kinase [Oligoflexus tunisiensis]|uniref:sensor histidine kinase n=1 Tax=Oligoflexus tunisiensis TaxID=708132 RepID=UPI00114D2254|nr:sensor histidine kinase [Oligoflexus tunisiensis]